VSYRAPFKYSTVDGSWKNEEPDKNRNWRLLIFLIMTKITHLRILKKWHAGQSASNPEEAATTPPTTMINSYF
jgi:hypothetical protein